MKYAYTTIIATSLLSINFALHSMQPNFSKTARAIAKTLQIRTLTHQCSSIESVQALQKKGIELIKSGRDQEGITLLKIANQFEDCAVTKANPNRDKAAAFFINNQFEKAKTALDQGNNEFKD